MKRKHLFLGIAALIAAAGLWFARSAWRSDDSALHTSTAEAALPKPSDSSKAGQTLQPPGPGQPPNRHAPPVPSRRFTEFTPEQRVEFARRGHGPGG